jgi:hypothetical protein
VFKPGSISVLNAWHESFYKIAMALLHFVKIGRMEHSAKEIMEISMLAARKETEYTIKYVKTPL